MKPIPEPTPSESLARRPAPKAGATLRSQLAQLKESFSSRWDRVRARRADARRVARLGGTVSQLREQSVAWDEFLPELEARFLELGASLGRQSGRAESLAGDADLLLAYVSGQKGGEAELERAMATLRGPLAYAEQTQRSWEELVGQLREHQHQIQLVRKHQGMLQTTIAPLKVIQTLFRIESARLAADVHAVFTGLTAEIDQLHTRVAEVFGTQFQSLCDAEQALQQLVAKLEVEVKTRRTELSARQEAIRETVNRLQSELAENDQREVRLTAISRGISDEIGKVVVALQYQDIARQKIQHIQQGVEDLCIRCGPSGAGDAACVHDVAAVEAGHIEAVLHCLGHADREITEGLERLQVQTCSLTEECTTLKRFKTISASEDGMVQVLLQAVDSMRDVTASTLGLQEEIFQILEPLGGLASDLTDTMRQLSLNIRFIALNAQIQAAHLGAGTGLETLAGHTCQISDETYRLNEEASTELDAFMKGLRRIIAESERVRNEGRTQQQHLDVEGAATDASLHAYRDKTLQAFLSVTRTSEEIASDTQAALSNLGFVELARPIAEPLLATLRELRSQHSAAAGSGLGTTQHLHARYTMQTDRAVHEAALSGADIGEATRLAPTGTVDLFEDFTTEAVGGEQPSSPNEPGEKKKEAEERPAAAALGDNVELF